MRPLVSLSTSSFQDGYGSGIGTVFLESWKLVKVATAKATYSPCPPCARMAQQFQSNSRGDGETPIGKAPRKRIPILDARVSREIGRDFRPFMLFEIDRRGYR
jgi:hypothetical protein